MRGEVTDKGEMWLEPRLGEHAPGVAANRKHLASLDEMVTVEREGIRLLGHGAPIDDGLAVILAGRLEVIELEQPIGRREELGLAELSLHRLVLDLDGMTGHQPRIEEAGTPLASSAR